MKRYARWSLWDKLGGVAIVLTLLAVVFFETAKRVEDWLFPVMGNTVLIAAHGIGDDGATATRLIIESEKLRDCEYRGIRWFLGEYGGRASGGIRAYFEDAPRIRGKGHHRWEGLVVNLPENLIRQSSYATVVHRCHGWWLTETLFFEGSGA